MTTAQYLFHLALILVVAVSSVFTLNFSKAPTYRIKAPLGVWLWCLLSMIGAVVWLSNIIIWLLNGAPTFGEVPPHIVGICVFVLLEFPTLLIFFGFATVRLIRRIPKKND